MQSNYLGLAGLALASLLANTATSAESFPWKTSKSEAFQQAQAEQKLVFFVAGRPFG